MKQLARAKPLHRELSSCYDMNLRKPFFLSLCLFYLLTGCATSPVSPENARNVPADRIYQTDLLVSEGNRTIPVTITRDAGFQGSFYKQILKVDGQRVAEFAPGETLTIYLEGGDYSFGAISERTIIGVLPLEETDVTIREGKINNFRIMCAPGRCPKVNRTGF